MVKLIDQTGKLEEMNRQGGLKKQNEKLLKRIEKLELMVVKKDGN